MSDAYQVIYGSSQSRHLTTIQVVQADITSETTDCIVNAANNELMHGGGVAGAIRSRGGPAIQRESDDWVDNYGSVEDGGVAVTGPGLLPTKCVIHAVGPVYRSKTRSEPALRNAIWNSLAKADELGYESISLPAISSGIFGYPKEDCAEVFFEVVPQYLRENPHTNLKLVRLSNFDYPTTSIFQYEFDLQFNMIDVNLKVTEDGDIDIDYYIKPPVPKPKPVRQQYNWWN
mmetsp:Transcript_18145/g.32495  ORF Transcript_18145/g.32495 Transcript_18145/m.32495 type:complete len:231 (+) Transcript_18145:256-948(+)